VVCPSCGYKNANESAPFCGRCGKPLGGAAPVGDRDSSSTDHLAKAESHEARKSSKRIVGIAALLVCLAIAGGGLVILHRSGVIPPANTTPRTTATKMSSYASDTKLGLGFASRESDARSLDG
jgi:hypothetical protein